MKNVIKYFVFGSVIFTGSVASAWWCSTCGEDHKDGAVCRKTEKNRATGTMEYISRAKNASGCLVMMKICGRKD